MKGVHMTPPGVVKLGQGAGCFVPGDETKF